MKHAIQYGIAQDKVSSLKNDFQDMPFTFKFDESTTTQVKKQYYGYVQYWWKKELAQRQLPVVPCFLVIVLQINY